MDNDELVSALDSYGEDMLRYIDAENELSVEAARIIAETTEELLAGSTMWEKVEPTDWHGLTAAFLIVYRDDELTSLYDDASLGQEVPATPQIDRAFLGSHLAAVRAYVKQRESGGAVTGR